MAWRGSKILTGLVGSFFSAHVQGYAGVRLLHSSRFACFKGDRPSGDWPGTVGALRGCC